MVLDPRDLLRPRGPSNEPVPLAGTRAERIQRLQIGLFGILAMVLLVGLADVVISRAEQTRAAAVPEAAPTVEPTETAAPRDPLADAGVVPELPAEPTSTASPGAGQPTGDVPPPNQSTGNAPQE
ncbi:hypothetical protein [Aurantiacibacter hainanensis]|uniref:hypothetical protein n=1 Tax=Aurantiacibacter hainanensis TaxID=3076114 RepID=UPI0030C6FFFF